MGAQCHACLPGVRVLIVAHRCVDGPDDNLWDDDDDRHHQLTAAAASVHHSTDALYSKVTGYCDYYSMTYHVSCDVNWPHVFIQVKPSTHYPCSWSVFTVDVFDTREHGAWTRVACSRVVWTGACVHGCQKHQPWTQTMNTGSAYRALQ